MREIDVSLITEAVSRACISANKVLPDDLAALIKKSADAETDDVPKDIMCRLCDNLCAAKELDIPICQDTGMAVIFAKARMSTLSAAALKMPSTPESQKAIPRAISESRSLPILSGASIPATTPPRFCISSLSRAIKSS